MHNVPRLGVAMVGLVLLAPLRVEAQGGIPATARVAVLVAQYDSAWNRHDTATVSRLLASQYQYFSSRGAVSSRTQTLGFLSAPDYVLEQAKRSELTVSLSGPVALVASRWQGQGTYRGEPFNDDQRCGQVWLQTGRTWQLLREHCVQIAADTAASSN
jgi:ketosteroid isomerase-like protein